MPKGASGLLSQMLHVRRAPGFIPYIFDIDWRLRVCVGILRVVVLMDQGHVVEPAMRPFRSNKNLLRSFLRVRTLQTHLLNLLLVQNRILVRFSIKLAHRVGGRYNLCMNRALAYGKLSCVNLALWVMGNSPA